MLGSQNIRYLCFSVQNLFHVYPRISKRIQIVYRGHHGVLEGLLPPLVHPVTQGRHVFIARTFILPTRCAILREQYIYEAYIDAVPP